MMTPTELAAVRAELARARHSIDLALGRALQLVDVLETERDERLSVTERGSLGGKHG